MAELLCLCKFFVQLYNDICLTLPYRTYNDPNEREIFINGTGAVDIYGMVKPVFQYSLSPPVEHNVLLIIGWIPSEV